MALALKWTWQGAEVDAILRIYALNVGKGMWLSVQGRSGHSGFNDRNFYYTAYYKVCSAADEEVVYMSGEANIPYDLATTNNAVIDGYNFIKTLELFQNSTDI